MLNSRRWVLVSLALIFGIGATGAMLQGGAGGAGGWCDKSWKLCVYIITCYENLIAPNLYFLIKHCKYIHFWDIERFVLVEYPHSK